jgi:hypothetical protein
MFKILGEDKVMVEKLTPERLQAEFSLGPDAPQVGLWGSSRPGFGVLGVGASRGLGYVGGRVMVEKLTPERLQAEFSLGPPDAPQVGFWGQTQVVGWCSGSLGGGAERS